MRAVAQRACPWLVTAAVLGFVWFLMFGIEEWYGPPIPLVWWLPLIVILGAGAFVMWRRQLVGALLCLVLLYLYLQSSSHLFLIPWYKDGGNGAGMSDWSVWVVQATTLTGLLWAPVAAFRRAARRR